MAEPINGTLPRVLVVDDDRLIVEQVLDLLGEEGILAAGVSGGREALSAMRSEEFDAVLTDVVMADMSGIDLLREIRRRDRLRPVICMSGTRSFESVVAMLHEGASDFLAKPITAEELVPALKKAHLRYQEALAKERIVARSEKWARELLALRVLGESSSRDILGTLFRKTVEAVGDTLQVETVSLMLVEGDALLVTQAIGIPQEVIGKARVPLGKGISGFVAQSGKPLLLNDISKDERFRPSKFQSQYTTQSALCVPLVRGERVLGVLNTNNKKTGEPFTESDRDLLVTIAAQVALSIENARLFRGLEEKAEALARAHQELVRLDKDKTELILNISHELKTPLTSIIGFASLVESLELSGEVDGLKAYMEKLLSSAGHLNHLVERMLELFRLEAGRLRWQQREIALSEAVAKAMVPLSAELSGRKVEQDYGAAQGVLVPGDINFLSRAIELVLENAGKFSGAGTPISITARWSDGRPQVPAYAATTAAAIPGYDGWALMEVRDSGVGMREKDIPCIFDKFKQLGDIMTSKPKGVGLGLSIARAIMERHGGAIWAESAPGKGSTLFLALPAKRQVQSPESKVQG